MRMPELVLTMSATSADVVRRMWRESFVASQASTLYSTRSVRTLPGRGRHGLSGAHPGVFARMEAA